MGYFDEVTKWKGLDQIRGPKRASDAPPSVPPASASGPRSSLPPAPSEPPAGHDSSTSQRALPSNVHVVTGVPTATQTPGVVMVTVPQPSSAGRFRFLAIGLLLGAIVTVVAVSPSLRGIRATLAKLMMPEEEPVRSRATEVAPLPPPNTVVAPAAVSVRPAPLESKPIAKASTLATPKAPTTKGPQRLPDHRAPSTSGGVEPSQGAAGLPPGLEGLLSPETAGKGFEGAAKALNMK